MVLRGFTWLDFGTNSRDGTRFFIHDLSAADEIFVCNSVIGIWGIRELNGQIYSANKITQNLQLMLESEKQKQVTYAS